MEIREVSFDTMESVRKKCITFAKDGNTVVKPYRTLYSLENITHDIAHRNLYLEIVKESYRDDFCFNLWEDIGIICYKLSYVDGCCKLDKVVNSISNYQYLGINGFYKKLEKSKQNGCYINKVDIEICLMLGKFDLAKQYSEYREQKIVAQEAERQAELENRKQKDGEEEERRLAEIENTISEAENAIRTQKTLCNKELEGKTVVLYLLKKHGVNVPIKTQGWINNALAKVLFSNGEITYTYYKSSRDSTVFYGYLKELEEKILRSV